jgi:hypothetical protein
MNQPKNIELEINQTNNIIDINTNPDEISPISLQKYGTEKVIEYLKSLPFYINQIEDVKIFPERKCQYQKLNKPLNNLYLRNTIYNLLNIDVDVNLYKHQAIGINAIRDGNHVGICTSTSR